MSFARWIASPTGARLLLVSAGVAEVAALRSALPAFAAAAIAGAAAVLIVLSCARAWRTFCDEVIRAAHSSGWLWGAAAGLVAVLTLTVWLLKTAPRELPIWISGAVPNDLLIMGMLAAVLAQILGYFIFWTARWMVNRRG